MQNTPIPRRFAALLGAALVMLAGWTHAFAQTTDFTIAVFQSELYLPDFVLKDKGIGAKHGLNIKFVTPASGAAAAQLMLAGAVQGWTTDPMIIMNAAAQGHEIRIAGVVTRHLIYTVLVSKDGTWPADNASFAQKMAGLKGKKIGVSGIGAGTDNALILMLKAAGMSAADVSRVGIGQQQAAIGQLSAGAIDAFVSFSLAGDAMIQQQTGAKVYISTRDTIVPEAVRTIPGTALAVSGDFAAKNPKVVASWLAAEREALAWIKDNPAEATAVLNKNIFNDQQPEVAAKLLPQLHSGYYSNTRPDFKISQKEFSMLQGALKEVSTVQAVKPITFTDVVIPAARLD